VVVECFGGAEVAFRLEFDGGPRWCHKVAMNADQFLRCRVPEQVRNRFVTLAVAMGETPSSLLRRLIDEALSGSGEPCGFGGAEVDTAIARSDRVTVRLRPGDGRRLRLRAEARGAKLSTYLALLARAHLHADAPLPQSELVEVKRALSEVAAVARAIRQADSDGVHPGHIGSAELVEALNLVERARAEIAGLVQASMNSWESDLA
jgi:hypothetical protein